MSEDFFLSCSHLKTRPYVNINSAGRAINGSKVLALGIVNVAFRINGRFYAQNFRVVRGLVSDIFLGWDWMVRSGAVLDPDNGVLSFPRHGDSIPLIMNSLEASGCYYRMAEDFAIPANSKAHCKVEIMLDDHKGLQVSNIVEADPFAYTAGDVWTSRCISVVRDGLFFTEFINCHEHPIKLEKGRVLGYARFTSDEEIGKGAVETEMYCQYGGDDSGYESNASEDDASDNEADDEEEIECDPPPKRGQAPASAESCPQQQRPPRKPPDLPEVPPTTNDGIPVGAKKLKLDFSNICEQAKPYKQRLKQLLEVDHAKAFSRHDRDYGKTHLAHYRANLKDRNLQPIAVPPYRTRPEMREAIDKQAFEMLADGLVSHSTSPFAAPILLARKKCGGWRFLTDFRRINEACDKMVYPLPRIEDSLQKLSDPKIFSSLDLTKGFWQIPIHPEDRKYFAFSTENMHLEYLVAPMGAKNSPSILSALMQLVLRGLPPAHIISYLDDILVATSTMEQHLEYLDKVLTALENAGLKLNPSKCSIAQQSVVCLGHKLSENGLSPDPANIAKIKAWKAPQNAKKLRTFLGLTGYYRQFVRGYSRIAQVLTDLTHTDAKWEWTDKHQKAFEYLRDTLVSDLVMAYPDFDKPFIIKSDASEKAIGYVLSQKVDGKEKVIAYGSKKLSPAQQRWSTYDREYFGLVCAVRANAHYLRHAKFLAITDHRPLLSWKKTDASKDPTGRRTRWAIELSTYDFDLVYKAGKIHADADALSRLVADDEEVAVDDEEFAFTLLGMEDEADAALVDLIASEEGLHKLRKAQENDNTIDNAMKFIRDRKRIPRSFPDSWFSRNSRWFVMHKGILYKKEYSAITHDQILQAVIPQELVSEVISDHHGDYLAGHPSVEKMLLKLKRHSVWPSMRRDVEEFVSNCKECDQLREPTPANRTPRVPLEARNVWDWVVCDLLTLPTSSCGYRYVLVFIDVFSGFVKLYKLRNKTTEGVCRAFEHLTCLHGAPKLLSSDNGREFTSDLLTSMCKVKGAEKRTSVPYRPQSQGTVERFNKTLVRDLQKRILQYNRSWTEHLPYCEWTYNTTPRANDDMTPYHLMYGREPPLPSYADVDKAAITDKNLRKYFEGVKVRTKEIYDEARRRMSERREKEVDAANKRVKFDPLTVGEKVYELVPPSTRSKLDPKWDNLMTVTKCRPNRRGDPGITYECEKPDGSKCVRHYEQLKRTRLPESKAPPRQQPHTPQPTPTPTPNPSFSPFPLSIFAAFKPKTAAPVEPIEDLHLERLFAEEAHVAAAVPDDTAPNDARPEEAAPNPDEAAPGEDATIGMDDAAASVSDAVVAANAGDPPAPTPEATVNNDEELDLSDPWENQEMPPNARPERSGKTKVGYLHSTQSLIEAGAEPGEHYRVPESPATHTRRLPKTYPLHLTFSTPPTPIDEVPSTSQQAQARDSPLAPAQTPDPGRPPVQRKARKASSIAESKTKYAGPTTRRREKKKLKDEESIQKGMSKLIDTGKKLLDRTVSIDSSDDEAPQGNPMSDFSSHDLIRNRIGRPESFDEPVQGPSTEVENVVISKPNDARAQSRWSLSSLNPLSFFGTESVQSGNDDESVLQSEGNEAAAVSCDGSRLGPQRTSTPKD